MEEGGHQPAAWLGLELRFAVLPAAVVIVLPLTTGICFPSKCQERQEWVPPNGCWLIHRNVCWSPFPVGETPHIACGKVELIKNNCLAGVINIPWQSPITQQAQAARPWGPFILWRGETRDQSPRDNEGQGCAHRPEHSAGTSSEHSHSSVVLMQLLPIFLGERGRLREAKSAADTWPAGGTQLYLGARYQSRVEGSGRSMLAGEARPF